MISYSKVGTDWRKEQKYRYLDQQESIGTIRWDILTPDENYNWLTDGMADDWNTLLAMGIKTSKKDSEVQSIFKLFTLGISTNRNSWVYSFCKDSLENQICLFCSYYNNELRNYAESNKYLEIDDFVDYNKIKWSHFLKKQFERGIFLKFKKNKMRESFYRPFTKQFLYFEKPIIDVPSLFKRLLPEEKCENENKIIWLKIGSEWPMFSLLTNKICDLLPSGGSQCFPFYTYNEDGSNRKENITDWALNEYQTHYNDTKITKWDIFYYVYGVLHHPHYRERYEANLKRELPRIPYAPDFWAFSEAGKKLGNLHINYEQQPEYPLEKIENDKVPFSLRVQKMKLSKDKTTLIYNESLTLAGIPEETYEYKLGNKSALHWIIDQYQVKTDKRSGITNDPNNLDDPEYIVRLIGQVIYVSLETVKIVNGLPDLGLPKD